MTAVNPLFEFMPYGAPELIASQRSHQTRALAVVSAAAIAVFALASVLAPALPPPTPVQVSVDLGPTVIHAAPQLRPPAPAPPAAPRVEPRKTADPGSIPVPVPEVADPPPSLPEARGQDDGVLKGTATAGTGAIGHASGVIEQAPPKWGDPLPEVMPQAIVIIKPQYPDLPRDLGIEGRVYVRMLVGKDGRVVRAEIDPKYSVPMLDESALAAARQWVFTPAMTGGHPVAVWVGEMIVYQIH